MENITIQKKKNHDALVRIKGEITLGKVIALKNALRCYNTPIALDLLALINSALEENKITV